MNTKMTTGTIFAMTAILFLVVCESKTKSDKTSRTEAKDSVRFQATSNIWTRFPYGLSSGISSDSATRVLLKSKTWDLFRVGHKSIGTKLHTPFGPRDTTLGLDCKFMEDKLYLVQVHLDGIEYEVQGQYTRLMRLYKFLCDTYNGWSINTLDTATAGIDLMNENVLLIVGGTTTISLYSSYNGGMFTISIFYVDNALSASSSDKQDELERLNSERSRKGL